MKRPQEPFFFTNSEGIEYEVIFRKPDKRHFGKADGICTAPNGKNPKIHINPNLTSKSEFNTIVHELAHAFFWDKSEKEIYKFANTVTKFLFTNQKWRKTKNE
tara:strand:+ start:17605 stop:17913 length:309 start_codon:yes stop_codon:yes gene_type:complete